MQSEIIQGRGLERDSRWDSGRLDLPAVFGLLLVVIVCLSRTVLHDGDTYTHIAAGEWMLDHWTVLRWDPFSWTFGGQQWTAHEWLAEVLLAIAYRLSGLTGVLLLTAAAMALTFGNLARHVGVSAGRTGTMVLTTAALVCVMPAILARPHALAMPLLELWVAGLLAARREGRRPRWWLLAVMAAWANMHGGFAFGLAIAAAFAVEASIQAPDRRVMWQWWAFVAAAVGAAVVTPQGWDGLLFPVRLLQFESLALIKEWQPVDLSRDLGFEAVLLGLLALLAMGRVRIGWFRLLLLLGLVHLSLAHLRHGVLFGIAGALILAEPVGSAFAEWRGAAARPAGRGLCWAGIALAVLLRAASPIGMGDSPAIPASALAQLPPALAAARVLNSTRFGGYLALTGLRPFIDGRVELYGDPFVADYVAMAQPGGTALQRGIERYGIEWAILDVEDPLVARFDGLAGWRRQYGDGVAVVFVRG